MIRKVVKGGRLVWALSVSIALAVSGIFTNTAMQARAEVDVYTTPGTHHVNGRDWHTVCSMYSSNVERCRTEIIATQVNLVDGQFVASTGWVFNNLTYKPSPRAVWADNPLAIPGYHVIEGRRWYTECDTAWTGSNGCRSRIESTVPVLENGRYVNKTMFVFNNIVKFRSESTKPARPATPVPTPSSSNSPTKPVTPKPTATTTKPVTPKPTATTTKPATPKPTATTTKPVTPKPTATTSKPATPKPTATTTKPAAGPQATATTLDAVNVRKGPGTGYAVIKTIPKGQKVGINCWQNGTALTGPYGVSSIWYQVHGVSGGWISDAWIYTGKNAAVTSKCGGGTTTPPATGLSAKVDAFVAKWRGKKAYYDNAWGAQCVDLTNFYIRDVLGKPFIGVNYAYETYAKASTSHYTKVAPSATPQKGDIAVWGKQLGYGTGHIAVVLRNVSSSQIEVFDQNYNGLETDSYGNVTGRGSAPTVRTISKNYLLGYLRPR